MKPIIVTINKNNIITFTKEELQKLLNEVYEEGFRDGCFSKKYLIQKEPYVPYNSYEQWEWAKDTVPDSITPEPIVIYKENKNE